jgi:transposase
VKNDERDAQDLAAMLALGRLAEGWIAPPEVRELRELVRYRYSLIRHRTSAKAQIHGVMAKSGILPVVGELWGPTGQAQLDRLELPEAYAVRLDSLRNLLDVYEAAIAELDAHIHAELKADPGYRALLTLPGVGKVIAAIFVAEIGDITSRRPMRSSWPCSTSLQTRIEPSTNCRYRAVRPVSWVPQFIAGLGRHLACLRTSITQTSAPWRSSP